MKLYNCKVRLGGSLYNEVPKPGVTAAEIHIFRHLHGNDAVADIKETGDAMSLVAESGKKPAKRTQTEERDRLAEVYGPGLMAQQKAKSTPELALAELFPLASRLPEAIAGAPKALAEVKPEPVPEPEEESEEAENLEA